MKHILAALPAGDLILVARDAPPAPIIVSRDAPPRTRDAAMTLAETIGKISGQKPAVLDGEPKPMPERAIWIGVQPAVNRAVGRCGSCGRRDWSDVKRRRL